MERDESKVFLLNTADLTIGIYCLHNNQIGQILSEKKIIKNRNVWKSTWASRLDVELGKDFIEVFFNHHPEYHREYYDFFELSLIPGRYHPRIYRPLLTYDSNSFFRSPQDDIQLLREEINQTVDYVPTDSNLALASITQLSSLIEALKTIARVVHPTGQNLRVYGNEIRALLILACTEVESQLRAILNANSAITLERPKTTDYVKLKAPLRLDNYKVTFALYPWLGEFSPFHLWDESRSTQSLSWFDAYNLVKHNNENEYQMATLESTLNAIAAVAIMVSAQYGPRIKFWNDLVGNFFEINHPQWAINEYYFPPFEGEEWHEAKLFAG